jgi:hypothetical protein
MSGGKEIVNVAVIRVMVSSIAFSLRDRTEGEVAESANDDSVEPSLDSSQQVLRSVTYWGFGTTFEPFLTDY